MHHETQMQLPPGDQHGNIRVWDLTANACSCELVPEVGTAVRSLTVALDGSLVVAANNQGVFLLPAPRLGRAFASHSLQPDTRRIAVLVSKGCEKA